MKIKICGIKTPEEAHLMNETMPDFIGFVFAQSKRQVSFEHALELKNILNPKIKRAGVFVNSSVIEILKLRDLGVIDIAQLHGNYSEDDVKTLKKKDVQVIKVVRVLKKMYDIKTFADFVLFDYFSPNAAGGLNKSFDWNIKVGANAPYFIAGGINASNIEEMARKLKPYAADISSGAETEGIKTKEKVSGIIKIARGIKP